MWNTCHRKPELQARVQGSESAMAAPVVRNEGIGHGRLTEQDLAEGEPSVSSERSETATESNWESECLVWNSPWHFLSPSDCAVLSVCSRGHWNRVDGCTPIGTFHNEMADSDHG